jgi:hypothetical protein
MMWNVTGLLSLKSVRKSSNNVNANRVIVERVQYFAESRIAEIGIADRTIAERTIAKRIPCGWAGTTIKFWSLNLSFPL